MHSIDEQPKEAAISLLRTTAITSVIHVGPRKGIWKNACTITRHRERTQKSCLPYIKGVGQKKLLLGDWNMWKRNQQKLARNFPRTPETVCDAYNSILSVGRVPKDPDLSSFRVYQTSLLTC